MAYHLGYKNQRVHDLQELVIMIFGNFSVGYDICFYKDFVIFFAFFCRP